MSPEQQDAPASTPSRKALGRYARLAAGVALLGTLAYLSRVVELPECATIKQQVEDWGYAAPLIFFGLYVLATVAFVPGLVVTLLAGFAFGPVWGTLLVWISSTTGATLAFLLARYVAREPVERLLSRRAWFERFKTSVETNGLSFVMFTRLVPLFPFNGLNYACGIVPLRLRHYVVGSALGMLPGTFAYVYLGATGCKLIDPFVQGKLRFTDLPADVRLSLVTSLVVLAALSLLPVAVKRLRRRRGAKQSTIS